MFQCEVHKIASSLTNHVNKFEASLYLGASGPGLLRIALRARLCSPPRPFATVSRVLQFKKLMHVSSANTLSAPQTQTLRRAREKKEKGECIDFSWEILQYILGLGTGIHTYFWNVPSRPKGPVSERVTLWEHYRAGDSDDQSRTQCMAADA